MKIACLFAGQGAQYPGMGRDLYEKYEKSRRVFDEAGEKIKQLCFEGTAEELKLTENTQPCVYTVTNFFHVFRRKNRRMRKSQRWPDSVWGNMQR